MKKFILLAVITVSSLSIFSCTTDDSDLVEETVIETELETYAGPGHGHVRDTEDD